jgi:hypothetical protein
MILSERKAKENLERTVGSDYQVGHGILRDYSLRYTIRNYSEPLF